MAKFLSHGPTEWMRAHPRLWVGFVVPIIRDEDTAVLHAWYEQVLFRDISPMPCASRSAARIWRN